MNRMILKTTRFSNLLVSQISRFSLRLSLEDTAGKLWRAFFEQKRKAKEAEAAAAQRQQTNKQQIRHQKISKQVTF
jgi:hypothetical protein